MFDGDYEWLGLPKHFECGEHIAKDAPAALRPLREVPAPGQLRAEPNSRDIEEKMPIDLGEVKMMNPAPSSHTRCFARSGRYGKHMCKIIRRSERQDDEREFVSQSPGAAVQGSIAPANDHAIDSAGKAHKHAHDTFARRSLELYEVETCIDKGTPIVRELWFDPARLGIDEAQSLFAAPLVYPLS